MPLVPMLRSLLPGRTLAAAGVAATLAAGLAAVPTPAASAEVALTLTKRLGGFERPTQVTAAHDGSGRLFVTEQTGRVRVVKDGRLLRRPFLDLRSRVRAAGEGGLLSIAFHPNYTRHPYVWVSFTNRFGNLRVARLRARSATANRVLPRTFHKVLDVHHPKAFTNHFAGQLVFGLSGLLFVSTGDGGSGGDPDNHAQDLSSLQGKILRLKVLHAQKACGRLYCVPASNPYAGPVPGRGEIWASGVRNAWRMSVDPATGDLWLGDVGQDRTEEIDRIPAGVGGTNLGWSCLEGTDTYDESRCSATATYLEPEWSYGRDFGATVIGGFVYRGTRYADLLGGQYVFGDFVAGEVFVAGTTGVVSSGTLDGVTSFGEDDDRELWAVSYDGGLYQLSAA
jgi:glucose/arabinose dehydrogenase